MKTELNSDYDLVSLAEIKAELLSTEAGREAYHELQIRKVLIGQLRHARKAQHLTQAYVANKLGTQKQNISRLERGEVDPQLGTISRYAAVLGGRFVFQSMPTASEQP